MKHPWLAYTIVGVLSLGVGVAIAGLPSDTPTDAVTVSSSVDPPATTATTTTTTTVAPTTTEPVTTETGVVSTDVVTTDVVTTDLALGERDQVVVVAANGAQVARAATRMATGLEAMGYVDVSTLDGTQKFDYTTVYYADGFEAAAARTAADLALFPDFIAPLVAAPSVPGLPTDVDLLVYVGVDRAS